MLDTNLDRYDLEVQIRLLTAEEGGRKKPSLPWIHYHDHFCVDGFIWLAHFHLQDREDLKPGVCARVFVTFPDYQDALVSCMQPGKSFCVCASSHRWIIGKGVILSILNLEKHAEEFKRREEEERKASSNTQTNVPSVITSHNHKKKKGKNK